MARVPPSPAANFWASATDGTKPNAGLTTWPKGQIRPRQADVAIAKNYQSAEEIDQLNRIVTIYLEFAELQAMNRKTMTMRDWIAKLDQFLQISEREILTHAGTVTAEAARVLAEQECEKYQRLLDAQPSPVEQHFEEAVKKAKLLAQSKKKPGDKPEDKA